MICIILEEVIVQPDQRYSYPTIHPGDVVYHYCPICSHRFRTASSVKKHLAVHTGETTCPECNKVFSRVSHMKKHYILQHTTPHPTTESNSIVP